MGDKKFLVMRREQRDNFVNDFFLCARCSSSFTALEKEKTTSFFDAGDNLKNTLTEASKFNSRAVEY